MQNQDTLNTWQQRVLAASRAGQALRIQGSNSKAWYGEACIGDVFDTRALSGIIAYEPSELVITAYCGTPLQQVEALLAQHQQMLAFEPPSFGAQATVGGMFAAGLAGPRRAQAGALREYTLGASVLDGRGQILHFGGQVMKNVAGYDVSRLLAGSLGTLGIVLQVSLKVMPIPVLEHSLRFEMRAEDAINNMQRWRAAGLPISASLWEDGQLSLRLSGGEAAVQAARKQLGGASLAHASNFWRNVREQELAFFMTQAHKHVWRLSLPANAPHMAKLGPQLIEWEGAQRWLCLEREVSQAQAPQLRRLAQEAGGHASLFRASNTDIARFTARPPALAKIEQRLRLQFDPAGIFNRGRMDK
jgi:glycolate oxidase FAD binding subunit